jgi:hypothetical protein
MQVGTQRHHASMTECTGPRAAAYSWRKQQLDPSLQGLTTLVVTFILRYSSYVQLGVQLAVSLNLGLVSRLLSSREYLRSRISHLFCHHLEGNNGLMALQVTSETVEYL